jgi:hypothetical protein
LKKQLEEPLILGTIPGFTTGSASSSKAIAVRRLPDWKLAANPVMMRVAGFFATKRRREGQSHET